MIKKIKISNRLLLVVTAVVAIGSICFGAEGEESAQAGIPKIVFYEALNFFGLIVMLYFLLRKKVSQYFSKRHDNLTSALREARRLKEEAEQKYQEYSLKIQNLEKEAGSVLEKIRKEGEDSKARIIEESKRLAAAIQTEAKHTAQNEIEKAKTELYNEALEQSLSAARTLLTKGVIENDQRRLQKEFVEKIEAVQ